MKNLHAFVTALVLLASPSIALGEPSPKEIRKRQDHDLARNAVLRREVLPLTRILTLANGYQPGSIIEIELKSRRRVVFYDVHVLTSAGVVRELFINARDGRLISNRIKED